MKDIVLIIAMLCMYFHISGLATTNILRLTAGNTSTVLSSRCVCDNCGAKIPALLQLPIISYIICRGRCKSCGCKIPASGLCLELIVFSGMSLFSAINTFSIKGVFFSFAFYEIIRVLTIIIKGKRKTDFIKQYVIAVVSLLPFLLCVCFVSALYSVV